MHASLRQLRVSECPVCKQRLTLGQMWRSVRCPHCRSVLCIDARFQVIVSFVAVVGLLGLGRGIERMDWAFGWMGTALVFGVGAVVVALGAPLLFRVAVRKWHESICRRCRYDLRASLEAGTKDCPECGHPIPHRDKPASDVAEALAALNSQQP